MSDAEGTAAEEAPRAGGREVWIEKYRPETLDDVLGQEAIVERIQGYINQQDLPHLLFSGPAGVGKCVTGETPVLTNSGLERVEDLVGDVEGFDDPPAGTELVTFGGGEFHYVEPSDVFGKRADEVIEVETRDGARMTVTPEHRLFVLGHDGLGWKTAAELQMGDRVVRPLAVPTPPSDGRLDWMTAMDDERIRVRVADTFADSEGLDCRELSLPEFRSIDATYRERKDAVDSIRYVGGGRGGRPIEPAWEITPELARFVGLAISEARIEDSRVKFYNTDEDLLDAFEAAAESLFGLEADRGIQHDVPYVALRSQTLTEFLEATFDVFRSAARKGGIGSTLIAADEESRAAFLRAVFDAEAYVSENGHIELTQKNGDHITLVSYLLATFGVPSRRTTEQKAATNGTGTEREYHALYISGAQHLSRFADVVGFSIDYKAERLAAQAAREPNPNHDTMPVQQAVDELCDRLHLAKGELLTDSLNPETPGRENYLRDLQRVLDAANDRLETAQRTLERLDALGHELRSVTSVPATWVAARDRLEPIEVRRRVSDRTGVRSDRLLEYADGRRTPEASRAVALLDAIDTDVADRTDRVQASLRDCITSIGVPYSRVADETDLRGTEVINLLEGDHDLGSLTRFSTVADRVRRLASEMLSLDVIELIDTLDALAAGNLYFDEVTRVERVQEERRVYDVTVPETHNYVAGSVPTVMHNTTTAQAIAREIYGDDWRENFLELNASDQRGIDVVRERIKDFARSAFGGYNHRIIFLDEADALTSQAQGALRRTMEQFSANTRFILSCNYSSQIIDPIQSRCAVFRFSPLGDEAIAEQVRRIAEREGIEVTEEGVDALVYAAGGDMRTAINGLQAASVATDVVDEDAVFEITSTARPETIQGMVERALAGDFTAARSTLDELLVDEGIAGGDVIDQLHRSVWEFGLDDRAAVRVMDRVGEADYRIAEGANERVQLEALLAALALEGENGD